MRGDHSRSGLVSAWIRLDRLFEKLGNFSLAASGFLLFLMMVLVGAEIFSRSIFHVSTQISEEYSGYLFTWMTLVCFLYAQRNSRFLRIDAVRIRLPPRVRATLDALASLLAAVLTAIILYSTWEGLYASWMFQTTSIQYSQTPLYLPQAIMPVGFLMLLLAFLHTGIGSLLQVCGRLPMAPALPKPTTDLGDVS